MNVSFLRTIAVAAALIGSGSAQERIRHTDELFPGGVAADDAAWLVTRVVDDLTGAPIAGAEIFLVGEHKTPLAGEFWFSRKGSSDADGFVRIPLADLPERWDIQVLRHPQHGVASRSGRGDEVWRIGRPFDVPVLVRDWQGRPVAGARIGFCGGCGHTPDLVNATTGPDGIAMLRGIDPHNDFADVYVQHPGLGLGYRSVDWFPGDPPAIVDCAWSPAKAGKVVDHKGRPIAGAFVDAGDVHRGPWAKTAADGTFVVLGAPAETSPSHVVTPVGREIWFPSPATYPVTLQLPDLADPEAYQGTIDARHRRETTQLGTRWVPARVEGFASAKGGASTWWPGAERWHERREAEIEVPQRGPFVIGVAQGDEGRGRPSSRSVGFADASELPAALVLRPFAPTRVRALVVDERGETVGCRARVRSSWSGKDEKNELVACAGGRLELATGDTGLSLIEIVPERAELRPRLVWATLPLRSDDAAVDLGTMTLRATPQLRVLGPGDRAPEGVTVGFARAGLLEAGQVLEYALAEDGAWLGPDLRAGDAVVVQDGDDGVPFRTVLAGDAPWTIRPPHGELVVTVVDEQGEAVAATILIGDHAVEANGETTLRGLPFGPVRLIVSAPARRSAIVETMVVAAGAEVRVVLQAR